MGADDLEIARRFRIALEAAAKSGDREALYPFLAADVEWVTPKRTLHGIDEVKEELIWGSPDENLELEFEEGEWVELGDGRLVLDVHQVYRVKARRESPSSTHSPLLNSSSRSRPVSPRSLLLDLVDPLTVRLGVTHSTSGARNG